jgi:hypothetical protein
VNLPAFKASRLFGALACVALLALSLPVASHPGGLNAQGCHNDRKNGGYHCHRPQGATPPAASQIQSLYGEQDSRSSSQASGARYFPNCAAARAAGAAPVRRGQPGYGTHLDRDGDGVGCE